MPATNKNLPAENLPLSAPDLTGEDFQEADRIVSSPSFVPANQVRGFEDAVKLYMNAQFAVGVSSVALGLRLAIQAAGIQAGDLVITTPFDSATSTKALLEEGAVSVFVDVEPRTANIDPHLVFAAAQDIMQGGRSAQAWVPARGAVEGSPLKAFLPVDVGGQTPDFELILNTAWKYKLKVIEDSHEAFGASFKSHPAGSLGDLGVLGFSSGTPANPTLTSMVITDDAQAAELIRKWASEVHAPGNPLASGSTPAPDHQLDELDATLGLIQVRRLDELIARRQMVAGWYNRHLAEISAIELPKIASYSSRMSYPAYVIRFSAGLNRDTIAMQLTGQGIPTRSDFLPIHLQPDIIERFGYQESTFPVAEDLARRSLGLPFSGGMTEGQVERVCRALRELVD